MTSNIKVSEIMTKSVIVANSANTYSQVMTFFTGSRIQHLPVTEDDKLVGIISVNDMSAFVFDQLKRGNKIDSESLDIIFRVPDVMTPHPVSVSPDDTVFKVVEILEEGRFQALPVTKGNEIQGIVTNKDLVRMLRWEYTH